jgi:5,10-methylenetetrahydrofolate reductase
VGLFAEKTEITVTHQTTDDIKDRLRSKLTRLINPGLEDAVVINGDVVDLDDELGPKKEIYDG